MKRITRKISFRGYAVLALAFGSALWLSSCSEDEEPKDTTLPQATISGLSDDMDVWNNVPITVEASDDKGLATVDVFVDGNLVKTFTQPPYETEWDSNTVPDGEHTIKVVVTDASGNKTEKQVNISVKNVLISITIPANQLNSQYSERGFVFLSDEEGKVITATEYANGQTLDLKSSTFDGTEFYLTQVSRYMDGEENVHFETYASIERGGEWFMTPYLEADEVPAGQATFNFTNPELGYYHISTNGDSRSTYGKVSTSLPLAKSPGKLYVQGFDLQNDDRKYGLYSDIVVGQNNIDLSLVNQPLITQAFEAPEGMDYMYVEVEGFPEINNYSESYYLGFTDFSGVSEYFAYYPGDAFPYYETTTEVWIGDAYYWRRSGGIEAFMPTPYTGSLTFETNAIKYSVSGNTDMAYINFRNEEETANWVLLLPPGTNRSVPKFETPSILAGFNVPQLTTTELMGVFDYDGIENYSDLMSSLRTSSAEYFDAHHRNYIYADIDVNQASSGGRKKREVSHNPWERIRK